MTITTVRQVLDLFENATGPLSLPQVARRLNISQVRLEGMIHYWIRKGRIRESVSLTECGSCGHQGACPFVMDMPRTYEVVPRGDAIPLAVRQATCGYRHGEKES
jgi:hypothetical protein